MAKPDNRLSSLKKNMTPFEVIDTKASIRQLLNTLIPLILLWYAAYLSLSVSYWLTLPITLIASGFVVRTFIIFHDCCHQSFFKSRRANRILGTITGILTLCPYEQWKSTHSIHHATSSNLDKRGIGDMWVLTVEEYRNASLWQRLSYRIYRNPLVMFGLGPIWVFLVSYRFNRKAAGRKEKLNTYITNGSILVLYALLCWATGWQAFLLIQAPIFLLSGMLGIWLFYVQHQFEDTYYEHDEEWSFVNAAVEGSSYYKLPRPLQWITGNIGFHHVHHLSPKVPNYNLEKAHEASPPLQKATTITLKTSFKSISFRLWDEERKVFVTFKEAKALLRKPQGSASVPEVSAIKGRTVVQSKS
ncbi:MULTISPECIES: fatty acid desaturase [Paenibacillus]|uniref:Fatty acid desaturase n=3 Tax=Bacillales TaxID=1385 RepID=G4HKA7_9BACL|nr:fatty acid desaturase [Paenibacillus lactis]EHB62308.1 fatty acid desaturase [Paenibacillus lactis 154]MBP1895659.1 omega-6 fatty acid desaturase (delta-12 desaturase) [Paenibacillus lactis]GIO93748.1 fatty acid desaturase [Paenibacillus lactis]HAG00012.1 fatty acid desaturase [Paenibacillus lactis]